MDDVIYASQEEADKAKQAEKEAAESERKAELVKLARQRFQMAEEAESEIRRLADEDIRFRAGEQWDKQILTNRTIDNRPALVINRMPQFERQVTNEQRQAKPAIQVSPIDSKADPETAEVFQGMIRHIEYDSSADVAYDTGLTNAVRSGLGYIRLITEYESEESFDQCLKIKRVRDSFSVYMDPCIQEQDGSDANWAFVVDDGISEEDFKAKYPDADPVKGGWGSRTSDTAHTCQVVEYFYRERVEDQLLELQEYGVGAPDATGVPSLVPVGEPLAVLRSAIADEDFARMKVLSQRPTHRITVRWAKIAGSEVVEETEFPSKWIPIIPVLGDELWVNGKRILEGIIRNAKDPQRMYNYWSTAMTETIALAPKAPWIGVEGQFAGYEKKWAEASRRNVPYLEVRQVSVGGQPAPMPQRNQFDAPIGAMVQAMTFAADDMKSTTGIYDAALGNRSNEQTGVAIRARQGQSQISTMHYSDNLARSLRHLGRILIDAMPRVYSGARIVRILGDDETEKMVAINGAPKVEGQNRVFDIGVGRYDVTVAMGASYTSKRQEAVAASLELSRSNPQIAQVIADIMVRNMDWPGADEMADRLKKLLPPEIRPPDGKLPPQQILVQQLQQLGQQNQQMGVVIEQLTKEVHNAHDRIDAKEQELASKERIAILNARVALLTTKAKLNSDDANAALDRDLELMSRRLELDGINEPMDDTSTTEAPRGPVPPLPSWTKPTPINPAPPQGALNGPGSPTGRPLIAGPGPGPGPIPGANPFGPGGGPGGPRIP